MLGGGGVLNWSFIQVGMCDEVSVVIAAAADGSRDISALLECAKGCPQIKRFGLNCKAPR